MKTLIRKLLYTTYVFLGFTLFSACSEEYKYSNDYSHYKDMTMKIALTVDDTLHINLINQPFVKMELTPESIFLDNKAFIYKVSDPGIVTIDLEGKLTPLKEGKSNLLVKFRGDSTKTAECVINIIRDAVLITSIVIPDNVKNTIVQEGKVFDLGSAVLVVPASADNTQLKYWSDDIAVATVDEKTGIITGVKEGKTIIRMKTTDGTDIEAECPIEVLSEILVTGIEIIDKLDGMTIGIGQTSDLNFGIKAIPAHATNCTLAYTLLEGSSVTLDDKGVIKAISVGTVKIEARTTDGSDISKEFTINVDTSLELNRLLWAVTASHPWPKDDAIKNDPQSLVDGNVTSCLSLVKPGKSYDNINVPASDIVYVIIDRRNTDEFNYFNILHRNNKNKMMRVWKVSFYGSADGTNFTEIKTGIDIPDVANNSIPDSGDLDLPTSNYRYLKMTYDAWDTSGGSTMQIAELKFGKK